jgi:hypothetical protein
VDTAAGAAENFQCEVPPMDRIGIWLIAILMLVTTALFLSCSKQPAQQVAGMTQALSFVKRLVHLF